MTTKLDQLKQSARELKNAVAEFEITNAALMGAIEKRYEGKPSTTATNATTAPATGGQFVVNDRPFNDVLANYERV